ncbi:hypothetical protein FRB97_007985 [Tulasnella sp. 331]|nr:hypothetical protein FRB97_007985 [Tulasnella sp. 331]
MGLFSHSDSDQQNYNDCQGNKASWSHELIAGAASYEAAKAYENHVAENGQPPSHEKAKELLAGFAGAFVDREAETRGRDAIDRAEAKKQAQEYVTNQYDQQNQDSY